jgi:hypothetical protein
VHNLVCYGLCRKLGRPRAAIKFRSKDGFFAKWAALFSKKTQKERSMGRSGTLYGEQFVGSCQVEKRMSLHVEAARGPSAFCKSLVNRPLEFRVNVSTGIWASENPTAYGSKAFASPPRRPCKWGNSDCDQTIQSCQWIAGMLKMSTEARFRCQTITSVDREHWNGLATRMRKQVVRVSGPFVVGRDLSACCRWSALIQRHKNLVCFHEPFCPLLQQNGAV